MKRFATALAILLSISFLVAVFHAKSQEDITDLPIINLPTDKTSGLDSEFVIELGKSSLAQDDSLQGLLYDWKDINDKVDMLLVIKDLGVSEPVVCNVKDNKEWLRTDITGVPNVAGTVFLDYRCNLDLCLTKLVHGHNMKNGTMFGPLPALLELESCNDAPTIQVVYLEGVATYEVCAVLSVNSKKETLPIDVLASVEDTQVMLEDLVARSLVPDGVIHSVDSLVLNTCWYGESGNERNLHCIVVATRV